MSIKGWKHPEHLTPTNAGKGIPVHPLTKKFFGIMTGTREGYRAKTAVARGPSGTVAHYHRRKD